MGTWASKAMRCPSAPGELHQLSAQTIRMVFTGDIVLRCYEEDDGKRGFTFGVPCSLARARGGAPDLQQHWAILIPRILKAACGRRLKKHKKRAWHGGVRGKAGWR